MTELLSSGKSQSLYPFIKRMINTEALLVNCKQTGLEVNAEKTKHMFMSLEQNAQ